MKDNFKIWGLGIILAIGVFGFTNVTKIPQTTYVVTFKTKVTKTADFKKEYLEIVKKCLVEKGCVNYILHQSQADTTKFMLFESWETKDLWLKHTQSPHIQDFYFTGKVNSFLETPFEMSSNVVEWKEID